VNITSLPSSEEEAFQILLFIRHSYSHGPFYIISALILNIKKRKEKKKNLILSNSHRLVAEEGDRSAVRWHGGS
jgi:hypothetical protein